jgi:PAS domain S-box-containing protein
VAKRQQTLKGLGPDSLSRGDAKKWPAPDSLEDLLDQLKLERARLSATLDSLMDPHVMFEAVRDRSGKVVDFVFADAKDAAIAYNHSTREAMIGARLLDVLPGHEHSGTFDTYVHALESGEPMVLDDSIYYNEIWGSLRHCDVRAQKVGDGLSYTWRDVTDRVQLIEHYRLLAENASDVVYETDLDGVIRWMSPSAAGLLKWSPEDLIGRLSFDLIHEDDLARVLSNREPLLRGENVEPVEVRYRSADGEYHWMSKSTRVTLDDIGTTGTLVIGLRSIDDEVATRQSLEASESHFRLLAENSLDVVLETDLQEVIQWASPSVREVLGWEPEALVGTKTNDLLVPAGLEQASNWRERVHHGEKIGSVLLRTKTAKGEVRWMALRTQPALGPSGEVIGIIIGLRDAQSEVVAQRAANTLAAGSQALVRSEHEQDLLFEMCQAAVDEGGYLLAWYARRVDDARRSIEKVASSTAHREYVKSIKVDWGSGPLGMGSIGTGMRTGEVVVLDDLLHGDHFAPWRKSWAEHGFRSSITLPVHVDGLIDGCWQLYAAEATAFDEHVVDVLKNLASELGFGLKRLRDRERLLKALSDQSLLSKAIDQASESIVVTDPSATIVYANSSVARTSGYELEDVLGRNPSIFSSGLQDATFFQMMWAHLAGGEAWHGTLINRRKSGELYEEDTTISPIHDGEGRLSAYVAVKRDLTVERRLETIRTREQKDRLDVLDIIQEVRRGESLHTTAEAFCRAATNLTSIDSALMVLIQADGTLLTIGTGGESLGGATSGATLEYPFPERLIERTLAGAWWLDLSSIETQLSDELTARMVDSGVSAIGNVPIRWEGQLVGILALASKAPDGPEWMSARLPVFEELGSYAGALFGAEAEVFSKRQSLRNDILTVMSERTFHPVFQPFVDLKSGHVVGYEALTRFDDGKRPEQRFMQAHSVGLGSELEALCAIEALEASKELPTDIWLSINFSPAALIDGHAANVVRDIDRQLVIEVTEHTQIKNYAAIRRALQAMGNCQLAVDDAGAGYTSLNHILELRPNFVKLDISLVRDIDTNAARQAMVAGMCHFAAQSGTTLIAEGIETESEASMLRDLGVPLGEGGMLGQGYLFGRPQSLD